MIAGVRLRNYRARDFDRICEIDARCFSNGLHYTPPEMRTFLKGAWAMVAQNRRGTVVGFVMTRRNRVVTLDVLPEYRRRGIGRALMEACEKRMQPGKAMLEVGVRNREAQALYRALGYTRVKRLPCYYPNGEDGWLLEKTCLPGS